MICRTCGNGQRELVVFADSHAGRLGKSVVVGEAEGNLELHLSKTEELRGKACVDAITEADLM